MSYPLEESCCVEDVDEYLEDADDGEKGNGRVEKGLHVGHVDGNPFKGVLVDRQQLAIDAGY